MHVAANVLPIRFTRRNTLEVPRCPIRSTRRPTRIGPSIAPAKQADWIVPNKFAMAESFDVSSINVELLQKS